MANVPRLISLGCALCGGSLFSPWSGCHWPVSGPEVMLVNMFWGAGPGG